MNYREATLNEMDFNPFERIGNEWMLVTAGSEEKLNTMTASWGQAGIMWGKPVVNVFLRPQRYTREFVDKNDRFTLSFFGPDAYRDELFTLGTKSGRNGDKLQETGLSAQFFEGIPAISGAKIVLVCKKLYQHDLVPQGFNDKEVDTKNYAKKDYHRMYIAEIEKIFLAE